MSSTWLKMTVQWILVVACAEAVSVPVAAFTCVLSTSAALQIQDERETETVAVASESRGRVEAPQAKRALRVLRVAHDFRPDSIVVDRNRDHRSDLKARFLSLRC